MSYFQSLEYFSLHAFSLFGEKIRTLMDLCGEEHPLSSACIDPMGLEIEERLSGDTMDTTGVPSLDRVCRDFENGTTLHSSSGAKEYICLIDSELHILASYRDLSHTIELYARP